MRRLDEIAERINMFRSPSAFKKGRYFTSAIADKLIEDFENPWEKSIDIDGDRIWGSNSTTFRVMSRTPVAHTGFSADSVVIDEDLLQHMLCAQGFEKRESKSRKNDDVNEEILDDNMTEELMKLLDDKR